MSVGQEDLLEAVAHEFCCAVHQTDRTQVVRLFELVEQAELGKGATIDSYDHVSL